MSSHRFIPNTPADKQDILRACGAASIEDLLVGIPQDVRFQGELGNGPALSEMEIRRRVRALTRGGRHAVGGRSFLGAGVYEHFCPAVVNQLTLRGEFLTSYTPYQPEMSQGTLQALFEFQTMVADLFGMEVSNASHYDGSTSLAEGALMSLRVVKGRKKILVSEGVHPEYIEVMRTYLTNIEAEIVRVPLDEKGLTSVSALKDALGEASSSEAAAVIVQSPNFFGCVEDNDLLAGLAKGAGALYVANVTEPLSLGLLKPPGRSGADIATGEGQGFGVPPSYGGPFVGLFTSRAENVRQMPGRLCGESVDAQGRRAYTLTLSTREQHIRREKATSNICTNQNLMALWATIWLAMTGKEGFKEMARQNLAKAEYAKDAILRTGKARLRYATATFNEFTVEVASGADAFSRKCVAAGVAPGVALSRFRKEDATGLLVCVTELRTKDEIDELVSLFKSHA